MSTDPFASFGGFATETQQPSTQTFEDPFASFGGAADNQLPASQHVSASTSSTEDPFAIFGGRQEPANITPESTYKERVSSAWNNPQRGILGRTWDVANTPIIDIDSALGRGGSAGGFERGANSVVSGLTSPLSILLTLGTFGAGGLIESGGAAALRAAGLGAEEISGVTKGAQVVADAMKSGRTLSESLDLAEQAGVNRDLLQRGLGAIKDAGLDNEALLSKGLIRRTGGAALRSLGVSTAQAERFATGLQALADAGFTAQSAYQAAELSPRALDALKEGNYDRAAEFATEALAAGGFTALGAHSLGKDAGGAVDEVASRVGLKVKPSVENAIVAKNFGKYDADITEAGRTNELWAKDLRGKYGRLSPIQKERILNFVQAGMDDDVMARSSGSSRPT